MEDIQNGTYYSLGRKAFWFFVIKRSSTAIALFAVALIAAVIRSVLAANGVMVIGGLDSILNAIIGGATVIAVIAELAAFSVAHLEYGVSKIMLDDSSLRIVRGIVSKEEVALPYRRIQSVEIKQSPLYRAFGVGHVVIATTADLEQPGQIENESDEEVVPIMDYDLAKAVADALTSRAEVEKMQMTNK